MPNPTFVPVIAQGVDVEFADIVAAGTLTVAGASSLANTTVTGTLGVTGASSLANTTVTGTLGVTGAVSLGATTTATLGAAGTTVLGALVTSDAFDRFRILTSGAHEFGSGAGVRDTGLSRGAANRLDVTTADLRIATVGRGLQVAEGANAKAGVATLVAGTVTVNTTAVTANSRIQLTGQVDGGTPGFQRVSARVAGTSFTITSSNAADTSQVAWLIVEP
jgi:hypothetical protein